MHSKYILHNLIIAERDNFCSNTILYPNFHLAYTLSVSSQRFTNEVWTAQTKAQKHE